MFYKKNKTTAISFPLGGIGAGSIGLSGNGSLIDWEIFNRPSKCSRNGISHFCVRTEEDNKVTGIRILNGDLPPDYIGGTTENDSFHGFGLGVSEHTFANWPHFPKHEFKGEYPTAEIIFEDKKFPLQCSMTAWSVMIPGDSKNSSLPAAFFEISMINTSNKVIDCTVIGVLANPWEKKNCCRYNTVNGNQLTVYSGDGKGDVTLTLNEKLENISYQSSFYRGAWQDYQEMYYNDLMKGGHFADRHYDTQPTDPIWEPGLLAGHFRLAPGGKYTSCFIISWNIPTYEKYWHWEKDTRAVEAGLPLYWKNYYATVWKDSIESGRFALDNYDYLREKTFRFRDALFFGNLPDSVKDAISSCLSVLKSPTCLRLEDGTFYGWEGVLGDYGSCEGSCSHVWGYQQALPFLFPDLERSMRESHLNYSIDENGGSHFRLQLPLGVKANLQDFRPCADGQFGDVMKIYRDWKISGDDDYIRRHWQTIKKTVAYAWSEKNPDCWDIEKTGVLHGRQHHTLDMELFGPNAWLTGHYLGALDAAARMADFMEDKDFAKTCRKIRAKGVKAVNELFNGEYFCQKINLEVRSILDKFANADNYWNKESKEIKYQIADGCGIDAPLAQLYATLYGLDQIFEKKKLHSTLKAIFKYNFKKMRETINFWRIFSLNDEQGVVICTWPHNNRPAIPITYNTETMTGFEYAYAAQLAAEGFVDKSFKVISAIRNRFDGEKRNPWNEFECGSNYARSMAAYGLLPAISGFVYDRKAGKLGFFPKIANISCFWALGEVWGTFSQNDKNVEIEFLNGEFLLNNLELSGKISIIKCNGKNISLPAIIKSGDKLTIKVRGV